MTTEVECEHPLERGDWHNGSFICMQCGCYLHKVYATPRLIEVMVFRLLCDTSADKIAYLELQIIRDAQEPRFKLLAQAHPVIYADFVKAKVIHNALHEIRRTRFKALADTLTPGRALALLRGAHKEERLHLALRLIRNAQQPRFKLIKDEYPEIYADFIRARTGPHEVLLKNRRRRVAMLTAIIEEE